jgi:hypothetical protein
MAGANVVEGTVEEQPPAAEPHEAQQHPEPEPASTALAVFEPAAGAIVQAEEPDDIIAKASKIATSLGKLIEAQNLAKNLGGQRKHVEVGGWQALGTMLGALGGQPLHAETVWTRRVAGEDGRPERTAYTVRGKTKKWGMLEGRRQIVEETDLEYDVDGFDWEACVEIRTPSGVVVGRAEAMVSRTERTWSQRDDYAVRSMAETRAESRAYRRACGWIVNLAGYSPTPAEEMGHTPGAESAPAAAAELPVWAREASDERKRLLLEALTQLVGDRELAIGICRSVKDSLGVVPDVLVAFARGQVNAMRSTPPQQNKEPSPTPEQATLGEQLAEEPEPPASAIDADVVDGSASEEKPPFAAGSPQWRDAPAQAERWCPKGMKGGHDNDCGDDACAVHGIPF